MVPNLKKLLSGEKFNDEVIAETNAYFEGCRNRIFLKGIKKKVGLSASNKMDIMLNNEVKF